MDDNGNFTLEDLSEQEQANITLQVSEHLARARHKDYDEKVSSVIDEARNNPNLRDEILSSADPAQAMYEKGSDDFRDIFNDQKY